MITELAITGHRVQLVMFDEFRHHRFIEKIDKKRYHAREFVKRRGTTVGSTELK